MNKKKIITIILVLLVVLVGGASIYVATQLSTRKAVSPTAPESKPKASVCEEACPGTDGVLRSCTPPEDDGTAVESLCNTTGRVESCGGIYYCCPVPGGTWTTDMTACPTAPTETYVGSDACTVTAVATAVCVPSGVVTCTPDCPTACGTPASTISTCTDSCGNATTKACPATADCVCTPSGTITCSPDCPVTCGTAASTITTCTDSCGGAATKACAATAVCGIDGGWSAWTACTATTCGTSGTKSRTCNNPVPATGGAECIRTNGTLTTASNRVETATCTAAACPTTTIATVPTSTAAATPTILPETGIFDLPGIAAFGGGLLLAVIGILLAL